MSRQRTYLDCNATEPLRPEAREALLAALETAGNPSSVHAEGRAARALVEDARREVAALVGADADDVYFTSGASEGNAWVLASGWDTIVAADIEHDSVLQAADAAKSRRVRLPVGSDGVVRPEAVSAALQGAERGRILLALQLANNETGVVQPVAEICSLAKTYGFSVLCDAVQAGGRIAIDMPRLGVDYLVLSAHKLGGPKGVGAVVAGPSAPSLSPLIPGGGQERRQRGGTENVAGIAGFGAAARAVRRDLSRGAGERMARLRSGLEAGLLAITPDAVIVGANAAPRLPNTTCVALPGRRAEVLVAAFDLAGIAVSAGAACSSGKVGRSRALDAMGLDGAVVEGAIRVSLGHATTEDDIAAFLAAWQSVAPSRRRAA